MPPRSQIPSGMGSIISSAAFSDWETNLWYVERTRQEVSNLTCSMQASRASHIWAVLERVSSLSSQISPKHIDQNHQQKFSLGHSMRQIPCAQ